MTPFRELRVQLAYLRKLTRLLGRDDALRFRAAEIAARLGLSKRTTITLHPPSLLHPVTLRLASTDAEVYGQVVMDQEYAAILVNDARTVVDCGANIGLTSAYFLSRLPSAQVIAIEPFPANAELCRRNLAPYGTRARVIEAAIWNSCTPLALEGTGPEWAIRVRPAHPRDTARIEAIDIPSLNLRQIDILKIDIEGSEQELFSETEHLWLPNVANIAIELHGPAAEKRFFDALQPYRYDLSRAGELTICRDVIAKSWLTSRG